MRFLTKRRAALLCAGLGTVGAASAFTFGATSAQYTSTAAAQDNSITSGTITLAEDGAASHAYNLTGFMPGDGACYSPPAGATYSCDKPRNEYKVDYTGSNPAFVGLDIIVTSTASQPCTAAGASQPSLTPTAVVAACGGTTSVGTLPLFDGNTGGGDLDLAITPENGDTAHQIVLDSDLVSNATCSTDASSVVSCTSTIKNALLPIHSGADQNALQWVTGSSDFVQVDLGLPLAAGNQFQGSNVHINLQGHAVQWDNNNTTKGSASPVCDATTTFSNGLTASTVPCPISWS